VAKAILILGLAALALFGIAGWQIASCELANFELHDDLRDLAPQRSAQIGLSTPSSDEDIRSTIVRYAEGYNIHLDRDQVTVQRMGPAEAPYFYLAADYDARVKLPAYSFTLHFNTTSVRGNTFWPFE
jgi:hypothetical protein